MISNEEITAITRVQHTARLRRIEIEVVKLVERDILANRPESAALYAAIFRDLCVGRATHGGATVQ